MSKAFTPTAAKPGVITANDLREGHNVWMCEDGWTADPAQATLFEDEAIADLALLKAVGQSNIVVGPYLVEARRGPTVPNPPISAKRSGSAGRRITSTASRP